MMENRIPTCTAIITNYNHSAFIKNALDCALNQTVPFDEIIIIDDASTDTSVEVISHRIAGIPHIYLLQNPINLGVVATINRGVGVATSDFVLFMSADDTYSLHFMEWCRPLLETYPDIGMISGNISVHTIETGQIRQFTLPFPQQIARYTMHDIHAVAKKTTVTFLAGSNVMRREAILQAGSQWPELKWAADWLLYLLLSYRHPFVVLPETLVCIRHVASQYSNDRLIWKAQRPIIEAFIRMLPQRCPDEYIWFRETAVLPSYDMQALFVLLTDKALRHYLTPLLVWRLLTFKVFRVIGRLLPETLQNNLRQRLRV